MLWNNKLKIAIIEEDTERLESLLDTLPQFETLDEMREAQALLKESYKLLSSLKLETAESMKQMKKNIDFLNSTKRPMSSGFDIKS